MVGWRSERAVGVEALAPNRTFSFNIAATSSGLATTPFGSASDTSTVLIASNVRSLNGSPAANATDPTPLVARMPVRFSPVPSPATI